MYVILSLDWLFNCLKLALLPTLYTFCSNKKVMASVLVGSLNIISASIGIYRWQKLWVLRTLIKLSIHKECG